MKTLGQKIKESRIRKHMRGEDLGAAVGLTKGHISKIENDELKGGPDADTVNRIAEALEDNSIRLAYLEANPVFQATIPRIFSDLNQIKRDPAIVFNRYVEEAEESIGAAKRLAKMFSLTDPRSVPGFKETFADDMDQIIDMQRCAEIVMTSLVVAKIISEAERQEMYDRQQRKCEAKGLHIPTKTGTDG